MRTFRTSGWVAVIAMAGLSGATFTVAAQRPAATHSVSWSSGDVCPALPAEARQRTYGATIEDGVVTLLTGTFLKGTTCTFDTPLGCNQFRLEQTGDAVRVSIINPGEWHGGTIVERLPQGDWFTLTGSGSGKLEGTTIRASLNASIWYCPNNASHPFPCFSFQSCRVPNLELTITPR